MSTDVYITAAPGGGATRQRNAAATKDSILEAAKKVFSSAGYAGAGLREIASDAGVNVALISRYFGSKEKLFEQVLEKHMFIDNLIAGGRADFGRHVMHYVVDAPGERFNSLPMLIMSARDPAIGRLCVAMLEQQFVEPLGAWLGGDKGENQASRILLMLTGFITYSQVLPVTAFGSIHDGPSRAWMEQTLQKIVDES